MTQSDVGRHPFKMVLIYVILGIGTLFYLYPLLWLILNSLKHTPQIYENPWGLPKEFIWSNYSDAWTTGGTGEFLFNSILITAITLLIVVGISSMAAYALAKLKWKGSKITLGYFLIGMMVPIHATLIPLFVYFSKMDLIDSHIGLILIYAAFALPAAILILCGFLMAIPNELMEAAVIDGCSIYGVFWRIILPVAKSALMTIVIFSFVSIWNELLVALVFISDPSKMTLPVGLSNFKDQYTTDYAPMFAAILMATIPTITVCAIFSKRIMSGMAEGAIKG
ncbi:carbohydrate ABC transporter permease [Paenibacillus fonticola]|uniref:carbohydrate ABC transporter permease n=1 Tax=Paenibacillus fonticola TaxID=379896 RepID=UPI00035FFB63|nr:carbohydrate ABC transporter permease [Paenibacillus fonticola]